MTTGCSIEGKHLNNVFFYSSGKEDSMKVGTTSGYYVSWHEKSLAEKTNTQISAEK